MNSPEDVADRSPVERIAASGPHSVVAWIAAVPDDQLRPFMANWNMWGRRTQHPPPGDWHSWLVLAGRGFGKTRAGAEWVRAAARRRGARIALVAATMGEARAVMVEGESGLLNVGHGRERPDYEPSLGRLSWKNGATGYLYSAAEPDSLRGPQFDYAWADEIAKWPRGMEAWDNLMLCMRLGKRPRIVATTTPRPTPLIRRLIAAPGVVTTHGSSEENRGNLAPGFLRTVRASFAGTRLARQELDGQLIEDIEGSLWPRETIEACRVAMPDMGELARVVVGVDPPVRPDGGGDACGIVVCGIDRADTGYVLEDASVQGLRPEGWAGAVARAAARWGADRVIAEANQGGAMVESVLRAAEISLPVKLAHAVRGKAARAEPVAALYEKGRVKHAGVFPALEDEMAGMTIGGGYEGPGRSPDRADALVWALSELMLGKKGRPRVRVM